MFALAALICFVVALIKVGLFTWTWWALLGLVLVAAHLLLGSLPSGTWSRFRGNP